MLMFRIDPEKDADSGSERGSNALYSLKHFQPHGLRKTSTMFLSDRDQLMVPKELSLVRDRIFTLGRRMEKDGALRGGVVEKQRFGGERINSAAGSGLTEEPGLLKVYLSPKPAVKSECDQSISLPYTCMLLL